MQSNFATELSFINLLDETSGDLAQMGYRYHDPRYWPTHQRDYTNTSYFPKGFTLSEDIRDYPYTTPNVLRAQGVLGITAVVNGTLPNDPTTSAAQKRAGQMLRGSRPPVEQFNLARFALEQKDAPLLMRMGNYIPRSPKDLGGAVLNFLFGLKPTAEDLGRGAALALRADPILQGLIGLEKVTERRYNTEVLSDVSNQGVRFLTSYDNTLAGTTTTTLKHTNRIVFPGWYGSSGSYGNVLTPVLSYTSRLTQTLRTFATWEYFVPRPLGLEDRLPAYQQAALNLIESTKLDASVVYDLTPWTWLGNWFVDFGGLLRYQQSIVDNQQVMTNSGYTILTKYEGSTTFAAINPTVNNGTYPYFKGTVPNFMPVTANVKQLRITRRPCSPYAVTPSWSSFSNLQWGILGALGLARSPGSANIVS